jgi:putative transposase
MLVSTKHYKYAGGAVASLKYHLVWAPRRRRAVLVDDIAERLEQVLQSAAKEIGLDILRLNIQPDYVHMQVVATPDVAPTQIVHRLKSASASLREEFPSLKRLPSMWTTTCFVSSSPSISPETIELFVQTQSTRA